MTLLVQDIMSSPVVSLLAEQTMPLVEDIMTFRHIRHLPVIDTRRRVVGIVTHRDLLAAQTSTLLGLSAQQRRARQQDVRVADLMTKHVWTVGPESRAADAARLLLDHRFGCLPVVDREGQLVGLVTERDFLRLACEALEEEAVAA
jgi:CBS-domain-containing membrane protein